MRTAIVIPIFLAAALCAVASLGARAGYDEMLDESYDPTLPAPAVGTVVDADMHGPASQAVPTGGNGKTDTCAACRQRGRLYPQLHVTDPCSLACRGRVTPAPVKGRRGCGQSVCAAGNRCVRHAPPPTSGTAAPIFRCEPISGKASATGAGCTMPNGAVVPDGYSYHTGNCGTSLVQMCPSRKMMCSNGTWVEPAAVCASVPGMICGTYCPSLDADHKYRCSGGGPVGGEFWSPTPCTRSCLAQ